MQFTLNLLSYTIAVDSATGSLVNVTADAIVHPTNSTFYMGGEVGKFRLSLIYHKITIIYDGSRVQC